VSPLLRGVEVGLAHGFLLVGPFIKLGPLRNVEGVAEIVGSLNGAALVLILTACLSIYGSSMFQNEEPQARGWLPVGAAGMAVGTACGDFVQGACPL
jgi:photosystem I subunit 11